MWHENIKKVLWKKPGGQWISEWINENGPPRFTWWEGHGNYEAYHVKNKKESNCEFPMN